MVELRGEVKSRNIRVIRIAMFGPCATVLMIQALGNQVIRDWSSASGKMQGYFTTWSKEDH